MIAAECELCRLELNWTGRKLDVSAPTEGVWTPEDHLVAGTANSLAMTFMALARRSQLQVASFRITASAGIQELPERESRLTHILLEPEIAVAAQDVRKARKILDEAAKLCFFFSGSLWGLVQVKPRCVTEAVELKPAW